MAPHSSTLAWKIPWTEEPDTLQSMGLLRVGHDWATSLSLFTFMHWRRKWQPTPVFLPGESQGRGEPGGLPSMRSQSWTRLKRLGSSSSSCSRCGHTSPSLSPLASGMASDGQSRPARTGHTPLPGPPVAALSPRHSGPMRKALLQRPPPSCV